MYTKFQKIYPQSPKSNTYFIGFVSLTHLKAMKGLESQTIKIHCKSPRFLYYIAPFLKQQQQQEQNYIVTMELAATGILFAKWIPFVKFSNIEIRSLKKVISKDNIHSHPGTTTEESR